MPVKNSDEFSRQFHPPRVIGTIKSREIRESSGLVASRCNTDTFWTHNDSRNGSFIYAVNGKGEKLGTWLVSGAANIDWEDLATFQSDKGECFLYIGDIGNNARARKLLTVYRVKEPKVSAKARSSSNRNPKKTELAEALRISYPDFRHNAEALMVHPKTQEIYIITKRFSGASGVYKIPADFDTPYAQLKKVADFGVPALPNGLITGGEISSDGKRVIICDYYNGYEISLPEDSSSFDEIWKQDPSVIQLGKREQGEAICYSVDIKSVFATSEKTNSPFIMVQRK